MSNRFINNVVAIELLAAALLAGSAATANGTGANNLSDTQVFYDLGVNRWFIIELTWAKDGSFHACPVDAYTPQG